MPHRIRLATLVCLSCLATGQLAAQTPDVQEGALRLPTLGAQIEHHPHVVVLQVVKVDKENRVITFRKSADLKGKSPSALVEHHFGTFESERDCLAVFDWARPGREAVCFHDKRSAYTCLGNIWYLSDSGESGGWKAIQPVAEGPLAFVGPVAKLRDHIGAILAGKEVVITAAGPKSPASYYNQETPIYRDWLRGKKGRLWRIKASLRINEQLEIADEGSEHFVGWGAGELEVVPDLVGGLQSPDPFVRAEAAVDLGELGSLARPARQALRQALEDLDAHVRVYAAEALALVEPDAPIPFAVFSAALQDVDETVREAAAAGLATLGRRAGPAVPGLLKVLEKDQSPVVRRVAPFTLGRIRQDVSLMAQFPPEVVPALGAALREDADEEVRFWAARALVPFGPEIQSLHPIFEAALRSNAGPEEAKGLIAFAVAELLYRQGPAGVSILADGLIDPNCPVRQEIIESLIKLGPAARSARPALMALIEENHSGWPCQAICSLLSIDHRWALPLVKSDVSELVVAAESAERYVSIRALATLGPAAAPVVPALVKSLTHWWVPQTRRMAAQALRQIGPAARAAIPTLTKALTDKDEDFRLEAAWALWHINRSEQAIRVLAEAAVSHESEVRWRAFQILGEIGAEARPALPAIRKALGNAKDPYRLDLAELVARLGQGEERSAAIDRLIAELRQGSPGRRLGNAQLLASPDRRADVAEMLGRVGPAAAKAIPALGTALQDRSPEMRRAAAMALFRIDPRWAPHTVKVLSEILDKDLSWLSAFNLAEDLIALGPAAKPAVPLLLRATRHEDAAVHQAAVQVLLKIDPAALKHVWGTADPFREIPRTPQELGAFWLDLGPEETPGSHRALWEFILAEDRAVDFLRERLHPVEGVAPEQIARRIAELNDARFAVRKKAADELARHSTLAEPALRQALANPPSPEVRRQVRSLLERLKHDRSPPAIEALERIGTPAAKQLLQQLAQGAPEARQTREAKAALKRLAQ